MELLREGRVGGFRSLTDSNGKAARDEGALTNERDPPIAVLLHLKTFPGAAAALHAACIVHIPWMLFQQV